MIRIINGKNVKSVPIGSFYSTIAAYERIFYDEKLATQRQLLSRCNLNNYVEANVIYDKERSETEKSRHDEQHSTGKRNGDERSEDCGPWRSDYEQYLSGAQFIR